MPGVDLHPKGSSEIITDERSLVLGQAVWTRGRLGEPIEGVISYVGFEGDAAMRIHGDEHSLVLLGFEPDDKNDWNRWAAIATIDYRTASRVRELLIALDPM